MFTVRTIFPEQERVEVTRYDLEPTNEQGQAVCAMFLDFLSEQPTEFREKIPFLKKGETELEWASAAGGAAFATFFEDGEPISMGILISGVQAESDNQMLESLNSAILTPIFGEKAAEYLEAPERPLLMNLMIPGRPESIPRTQLLFTALASVYFRVMIQMHQQFQPDPKVQ